MPDYDMTMILVTHNAFRRDLGRLTDAAARAENGDPRRNGAVLVGWRTLQSLLQSHHVGEDRSMWPRMRNGLRDRTDELAVLNAMEEEHERIDPLLKAVDTAFAKQASDPARLTAAVGEFTQEVSDHLAHEENEAFPLVRASMSARDWNRVVSEMRGGLAALRAAPEFFPWLLEDAKPEDRDAVLTRVPPPLRLLYEKVWLPRYTRRTRW